MLACEPLLAFRQFSAVRMEYQSFIFKAPTGMPVLFGCT